MARALSAAQHCLCYHLSPSVGVIRPLAAIPQAPPFNPSFTVPPEPPRAPPPQSRKGGV